MADNDPLRRSSAGPGSRHEAELVDDEHAGRLFLDATAMDRFEVTVRRRTARSSCARAVRIYPTFSAAAGKAKKRGAASPMLVAIVEGAFDRLSSPCN